MSNIIQITDFLDPALDVYTRLTENQLVNRDDPDNGLFIAESPKVIERALNSGCVPVSILVEDRQIEGEAAPILARCPDVPVYTAPFDVLTQLTGFKLTRGLLCAMRRPAPTPLTQLLTNARQAEAVGRALSAVAAAREALDFGMTPDAVLTDAEHALEALGELTGKSIREDLVATIFSRFCVGK